MKRLEPSDTIKQFVDELDVSYGYEPSIKIQSNNLLLDRYLLSVHQSDIHFNDLSALMESLNAPDDFLLNAKSLLPQANIIHFGYERQVAKKFCKIYFELAGQPKNDSSADSQLLHRALKWDAEDSNIKAISEYFYFPGLSIADIEARINAIYKNTHTAYYGIYLVNFLLTHPKVKSTSDNLFYLEVHEEGNTRNSFDIRFYDARLIINEILPELTKVFSGINIDLNEGNNIFSKCHNKLLGHVSGGIGRDGKEFLTLYFGVEGRGE